MAKRWYRKDVVQAAIVTGAFGVLAALVAGISVVASKTPGPEPHGTNEINVEPSSGTPYAQEPSPINDTNEPTSDDPLQSESQNGQQSRFPERRASSVVHKEDLKAEAMPNTTEDATARQNPTDNAAPYSALWADLPTSTPLAVMLVDQSHQPLPGLAQLLISDLGGTASLFRVSFITSGGFDESFAGNPRLLIKNNIERQADAVLLGKIKIEQKRDLQDRNLIIVDSGCQATIYLGGNWYSPAFIRASGRGVEYRLEKAEKEAQEAMISDLINSIDTLRKGGRP